MSNAAVFQAKDIICAGFFKSDTQAVDITRHRLNLSDKGSFRVEDAKPVIHIPAGDAELHQSTGRQNGAA